MDDVNEEEVKIEEDEIKIEIREEVEDNSERMCDLCPAILVFYLGTKNCRYPMCYNLKIFDNYSCLPKHRALYSKDLSGGTNSS